MAKTLAELHLDIFQHAYTEMAGEKEFNPNELSERMLRLAMTTYAPRYRELGADANSEMRLFIERSVVKLDSTAQDPPLIRLAHLQAKYEELLRAMHLIRLNTEPGRAMVFAANFEGWLFQVNAAARRALASTRYGTARGETWDSSVGAADPVLWEEALTELDIAWELDDCGEFIAQLERELTRAAGSYADMSTVMASAAEAFKVAGSGVYDVLTTARLVEQDDTFQVITPTSEPLGEAIAKAWRTPRQAEPPAAT